MSRGVDEVELVALPVLGVIQERDALGLDGDAALAFQIHRVQHLFLHLPGVQASAELDQPVRQRGFAVIDVRNDGEVTYKPHEKGTVRRAESLAAGAHYIEGRAAVSAKPKGIAESAAVPGHPGAAGTPPSRPPAGPAQSIHGDAAAPGRRRRPRPAGAAAPRAGPTPSVPPPSGRTVRSPGDARL